MTGGDALTIPRFSVTVNHGGEDGRLYPLGSRPLAARTAKIGDGIVTPQPFVSELRNHARPRPASEDALRTITGAGNHSFVAVPEGAFIQKHHGGLDYGPIGHMLKGVNEPLPTAVARPNLSLVIPYRAGSRPYRADLGALSTLATKVQHGVLVLADELADCRFRMLKPREQGRGQRFDDSYIVVGNMGEQTMQFGNAVASNVAQWLGCYAIATLEQNRELVAA
jgi:DNA (cytosine-5)-methyltransferase 1